MQHHAHMHQQVSENNLPLPPVLLVTTLRQERDSLQVALHSELAHRRHLELEMEAMKSKLTNCERELYEVKEVRDRMDEEYRCAS